MTVRHLQSLRRAHLTGGTRRRRGRGGRGAAGGTDSCPLRPAAALSADPAVLGKYRAGFSECLAEVHRFLAGCADVPADVRSRLLGHLAACLGQLGPSRRAAEAPTPEACVGGPSPPAFHGPFPLPRPGAAFAPPLPRGLTGAPPAGPRLGPQGRGAPWRPWLR